MTTHSPSRSSREGGRPRFTHRRRVCAFCADKNLNIDYKRAEMFGRYVSERGTMEPRKKTGNCAKHQRTLAQAIKRARHLALLPFSQKHIRVTGVPVPGSRAAREYAPRDYRREPRGDFAPAAALAPAPEVAAAPAPEAAAAPEEA